MNSSTFQNRFRKGLKARFNLTVEQAGFDACDLAKMEGHFPNNPQGAVSFWGDFLSLTPATPPVRWWEFWKR